MSKNAKLLLALIGIFFAGIFVNVVLPFLFFILPNYFNLPYSLIRSFYENAFPVAGYAVWAFGIIILAFSLLKSISLRLSPTSPSYLMQDELNKIREQRIKEPGNVELDWDYGQAKIEIYINGNVQQMEKIFRYSMVVMSAGGFLIFLAIIIALLEVLVTREASIITPAAISGFAGIITEFIGATFLFIYRSTIQQASSYIKTLERINSVGMAMKIINTMSDDSKELKDKTKAEMVSLLLHDAHDLDGDTHLSRQTKITATNNKKKVATLE